MAPQQPVGKHKETLVNLLDHQSNHNVEWHDIISLLDEIGAVEQRHDGKYAVRLGSSSAVLERPRGKDLSEGELEDIRRLLREAGYHQ